MASTSVVFDILARDRASDKFDKFGRSVDNSSTKMSKLGGVMKGAAKAGAIGLGIAVVGVGKGLFDATKAAIEDEKSQALLANTLKRTTGATDKQVASVEDWITKQGQILGVTDDELRPALQRLSEATGDVGEAQKLAEIAMDASAGTGKSLKTVSEALMKAQNGNVGALSRLGIETKNAKGETLTFEEATKKMGDTFAGAASTKAGTLEGKMGRLKVIFDETKETIGAKLIPIVTKMADWFLTKGLPAISEFGGWIRDNLLPIFGSISDVVKKVFGSLSGDVEGPLGDVKAIIQDAVSIIKSLWKRFGADILDYARNAFNNIKQIIGGAFKVIRGVFKVFSSLLKGDWRGVWDGIKQILKGAWEIIKGIVKQALNVVKTLFKIGWSAIKGVVSGAWDGIKTLVKNGADAVVDGIKAIPGKIRALGSAFKDAGKAVIDAMVNGLKNAAGVIGGIAGNVWDAVKSLLNGAIDKINAALEFTISLPGPNITVNPSNIPHLAKGGVVTKPTVALIGEAGPEAVVPLGRMAPSVRGGDTYIFNMPGVIDKHGAAKEIEQILAKYNRATGRALQVRTI